MSENRLNKKPLHERVVHSQIWRSIFRHGYPDTERNQVLAIISNVFLHLHPAKISENALKLRHTWCMGGISFLLFVILTVTGILLMFYYRPTVEHAYGDMRDLEFVVPFGMFMRNLHRWAAHGMVLSVIAHMVRVFLTGSYKPPREFNWAVGVLLLVLTLLLSYTGYLLPWDQLAFWAVTVGTNLAGATPFIGHEGPFGSLLGAKINNDIRFLLLGGTKVGQNALLRFYVLHCILLPLIAALLMAVHFWRVRKDGRISGPL
jgi:quinol-cytochrome oxidoreductase complex cytochrome b subunit